MPESDTLAAAIGHIKYKVDSMDRTLEHLLLVNKDQIMAGLMEKFHNDSTLVKVYQAIDGRKTQKEIGSDISVSDPTVSRRINSLLEMDLIELVRSTKDGKVYQYTKMERLLKINRELEKLER